MSGAQQREDRRAGCDRKIGGGFGQWGVFGTEVDDLEAPTARCEDELTDDFGIRCTVHGRAPQPDGLRRVGHVENSRRKPAPGADNQVTYNLDIVENRDIAPDPDRCDWVRDVENPDPELVRHIGPLTVDFDSSMLGKAVYDPTSTGAFGFETSIIRSAEGWLPTRPERYAMLPATFTLRPKWPIDVPSSTGLVGSEISTILIAVPTTVARYAMLPTTSILLTPPGVERAPISRSLPGPKSSKMVRPSL